MEHALCEPVELTEFDLDAVAGGNPFNVFNSGAFSSAFNGASFAIGAVSGDLSNLDFSVNTGQVATGAFGMNIA